MLLQSWKPDFYNWNKVKVRYCDGSSFTGDVEEVDPVSSKSRISLFSLKTDGIIRTLHLLVYYFNTHLRCFAHLFPFVQTTKLHYRGARIWQAVMEDLLAKGMDKAENV
jgi:hypothetical protein